VAGVNGGVEASRPGTALTRVSGAEPALDVLTVNGQGGSDRVAAGGTAGADTINVVANGLAAAIVGSPYGDLRVETADEDVELDGLGGPDTLTATGNLAAITRLTFDGGAGDDTIGGGNGVDLLIGGSGADVLDGNFGADTVLGGADDDTIGWDPGDGSDTLEGGTGTDRLAFNGSGIGETFEVSPNGERVRFTRNIATITLDLNDLERIDLRALGGADSLTVNDLAGTDLATVAVDLAVAGGGGDASVDTVIVNGTAADDLVAVAGVNGGVEASRPGTALTRVSGAEPALDVLTVNGLAGVDVIDVAPGVDALIQLSLNP
jgi:hypothetical protein